MVEVMITKDFCTYATPMRRKSFARKKVFAIMAASWDVLDDPTSR
jgi:hypothetical protein